MDQIQLLGRSGHTSLWAERAEREGGKSAFQPSAKPLRLRLRMGSCRMDNLSGTNLSGLTNCHYMQDTHMLCRLHFDEEKYKAKYIYYYNVH